MPLELLFDSVQPVVELLRFGVQSDKFGHECRQSFVAQGCCVIVGDWCGETLDAAERAVAQHRLILWDQSATASTGAIKLFRTLRTQARTILRRHSQSD
jgi:hypothetical protein